MKDNHRQDSVQSDVANPRRRSWANAPLNRARLLSTVSILATVLASPFSDARASECGDGSSPAGGSCTLQPYNPVNNDGQVGAVIVNGGDSVTVGGPTQFAPGQDGGDGQQPLRDFDIVDDHGNLNTLELNRGPQNDTATYTDPITGTTRTVNVYDTANFAASQFGDRPTTSITGVGDNQYINARVGTVESTGGTLVVDVDGGISIAAKQTTLFEADGSGTANSNLTWSSSNVINMYGATMAMIGTPIIANSSVLAGWPTTVTLPSGDFTINDLNDFKAFNDQLVSLIENGTIDQTQYNALIAQGANLHSGTVEYQYPQPTPPDDIYEGVGQRIVMLATGANASATVSSGVTLQVNGANGGVLRAENGANIVNDGTITTTNGRGMVLTGGSSGSNEAVINSRDNSYAVETTNSTFENNSIINQTVSSTQGVGGIAINSTNSDTTNNGIINIGTAASSANVSATGVNVAGGSFTNAAGAVVYIGRGEQTDPTAPAGDVALNIGGLLTGVFVRSNSTVSNAGDIVIGSLTQGAVGLRVDSATNVIVNNTGTIDVNGAAGGTSRENIGYA